MGIELVGIVLAGISALSAAGATEAVRAFIRRDIRGVEFETPDGNDMDKALVPLRERDPVQQGAPAGGTGATPDPEATPGELEAAAVMDVYAKELTAEAKRIAKRAKAERPSKDHVRQAADRIGVLRDRAGVATDFALAIGSILIGAAISFQINLWTGGDAAEGVGPWMAAVLAVGVGIAVAAGVIKWRRV